MEIVGYFDEGAPGSGAAPQLMVTEAERVGYMLKFYNI
jgi:hypothetical protein